MSKDSCLCLAELINEGTRLDNKDFMISRLIVDDAGMDDEKLSIILSSLNDQKSLKSISLMNCKF